MPGRLRDGAASGDTVRFFDRGWSPGDRHTFTTTRQGSNLMLLAWFNALRRTDIEAPFIGHQLARYGYLPSEFGPWQTVYWWFRRFVRLLLFRTIHDVALMLDREQAGREASPSGGVLDSQTVKALYAEKRDFDGGKKIVGRKRHVAVDTDGLLLMVNLTTADVSDSAGAQMILAATRKRWPWLKPLFADSAYDRTALMDEAAFLGFVLQVVRRCDQASGFAVIPRRWVVERTFDWLIRWRRLVRDYEKRIDVSEATIHVAMGSPLLRRVARR